MKSITNKQIRDYLGHNGFDRKVKITQGDVMIYGSTNPFDRSRDYWRFYGPVEDVKNEIAYVNGPQEYGPLR